MGTVKDTTHEIIFDDSYPHNVPICRHGPALRLKSMKRTNLGGVKTSEKWVCRLALKFCFILLFDFKALIGTDNANLAIKLKNLCTNKRKSCSQTGLKISLQTKMTKLRDNISSRMKRYKSYLIIYHQRARSSWWAVLLYWQGF